MLFNLNINNNRPCLKFSEESYIRRKQILDNCEKAKENVRKVLFDKITTLSKFSSKDTSVKKMEDFLINKFDQFYDLFSTIIADFTDEDYRSIGSSSPTLRSVQLKNCFYELNENGFEFVNGRKINFWSGQNGKQKAWDSSTSLSDSKIPAVIAVFEICKGIQKIENINNQLILARFLPNIVSAIYSSEAQGEVDVFISNDKLSEKPSLTSGNNFWKSELPVLQALYHQKIIKKILIHLSQLNGEFSDPVDFNSRESDSIPVVRRRPYLIGNGGIDDKDLSCFVEVERWKDPNRFSTWCKEAKARPSMTLGKLREIARKWIEITKKNKIC